MMNFFRNISPKRLLYMQLIFTVLAFLLMVVLSYFFMSGIVQRELVHNAQNALTLVEVKIDAVMQEAEAVLGGFSQTMRRTILLGGDTDMLQQYVTEITHYLNTSNARTSGIDNAAGVYGYFILPGIEPVYLTGKNWTPPSNYTPQERPWFTAALAANGKIVVTSPYEDTATGKIVFSFARSIYDENNNFLGITCLDVPVAVIGDDILATALAQGGYGVLVSQNMKILAHPNPDFVGKDLHDPTIPSSIFVDDLERGVEVFERPVISFAGESSIAFFRELRNGWYLGLVTPQGPYYRSVRNMALILCALGAILAGALIYVLVRIDAAKTKSDNENKQKSAFLATMSHEMRTPLNAVIGLSELILDTEEISGENYSSLQKIHSAGKTLLSTVNDILDISKIESGKLELLLSEYDTSSMINDAVTQSILHIEEKSIQFILNIDENLPAYLYGDELRTKQILNNLLSNAFKYTKEGEVELGISCTKGEDDAVWLTIRVRDTGVGISSDNIGKLFEDYAQMDQKVHRRIMGTGLGLPITKKLISMMDGSITVESEYGKGSLFTVQTKYKFVSNDVIGPEAVKSLRNFHYSEKKRQRNLKLQRFNLSYARVLIVDDVDTNLDIAKGLMKPYGMQIDCVTSGQAAIDAICSENVRYNAIFMDHMMPGMDGIEATKIIREIDTEYAKTIPIIALTANAIVGNEEMFLSKGFQGFISKPIEINRLNAVLRELVWDKEQEKNLEYIYVNGELILNNRKKKNRRIIPERRTNEIDRRGSENQIPCIDMKRGIERFGGSKESFMHILRSYAKSTKSLLESIRNLSKENLVDYAITVHGIKGSSRGICADGIGDMAAALEKAAKEGNFDFLVANNEAFAEAVEKLILALDNMLAQKPTENSKPKMDKPDKAVLSKLLVACEIYDMNGVEEAMSEIEHYEYESDDDLVYWLQENIMLMNFKQIIERLSSYVKQ